MWLNPQFPADLVTFTEEILNGKLHFLCNVSNLVRYETIFGNWKPFKIDEKCFLQVKCFLCWQVEKWLDKKYKVSFKIYDITTWEANNCNTHIARYLKEVKQSGNEIWSVSSI